MQRGDVRLTPLVNFVDTKAKIEAFPSPVEGMTAQQTDSPYAQGRYANGAWVWGGAGGSVNSVTGDGVDNTDPANPVLTFPTPAEIGAEPADATIVKTGNASWIDLTDSGATTLHTHAVPAHNQNASTIIIPNGLGTPTYDDLQDFINITRSAGRLTGGAVSKGTGATISITAMDGMIFTGSTLGTSPLIYFKMPQQTDILGTGAAPNLIDNSVNWIYIDYAAGTPVYKATVDRTTINDYTMFAVGRAWVSGAIVEVQASGHSLYNRDRRAHNRLILKYGGMDRVSGATITPHATPLRLACDAGSWYVANTPFTTAAVDTFQVWYKTGGGAWTESASLTLFSDVFDGGTSKVYERYQNGTSLGTLSGSKYGVYWIFMCPEGDLYVVLGTSDYANVGAAQAATVPASLPPYLVNWGRLIGRVICQKTAAALYSVESVWATTFTQSAAVDHASLANLAYATSGHTGFVPTANGVTNGDAHDHLGGDGAQIAYSTLSGLLQNYLTGLKLSNNTGDATNDIDIATGQAMDATNAKLLTLASALTKRLDAAWAVGTNQGGLDTGSIANTTYHVWLITRSDTGVVDVLFSASATAPTMPASYDYKRRIGSIVRLAGSIKGFIQNGDSFNWNTPVQDVNTGNPGTAAVTRTLTVPIGIIVQAFIAIVGYGASSAAFPRGIYLSDLALPDTAASDSCFSVYVNSTAAIDFASGLTTQLFTNTSAQIRSRLQQSAAGTNLIIVTLGWIDNRGQ